MYPGATWGSSSWLHQWSKRGCCVIGSGVAGLNTIGFTIVGDPWTLGPLLNWLFMSSWHLQREVESLHALGMDR